MKNCHLVGLYHLEHEKLLFITVYFILLFILSVMNLVNVTRYLMPFKYINFSKTQASETSAELKHRAIQSAVVGKKIETDLCNYLHAVW